jgi:hypothetical protein
MTIGMRDFESFMNAIDECVTKGLCFEAYTDNLQIRLTGGH